MELNIYFAFQQYLCKKSHPQICINLVNAVNLVGNLFAHCESPGVPGVWSLQCKPSELIAKWHVV